MNSPRAVHQTLPNGSLRQASCETGSSSGISREFQVPGRHPRHRGPEGTREKSSFRERLRRLEEKPRISLLHLRLARHHRYQPMALRPGGNPRPFPRPARPLARHLDDRSGTLALCRRDGHHGILSGQNPANFLWAGKGGKAHWASTRHPIKDFGKDTWNDKFHLWVSEWDQEKKPVFLDAKLLNTLPMKNCINQDGPPFNPFIQPHHFRLNLAIGANGGDPSNTPFQFGWRSCR